MRKTIEVQIDGGYQNEFLRGAIAEDGRIVGRTVKVWVLEDLHGTADFPLVRSMSGRLRLYQWP